MYPPHEQKRLDHEEKVRAMFNRWAGSGNVAEMEQQHLATAEKVIARMGLAPNDSVLEVGCGEGWLCRRLAGICSEGAVVGIDVSEEMINLARAKSAEAGNLMFAVGAAEEIPWAEDYFTRVVSVESAYYWYSPERAARELFRVTAYGGRVFLLMSYYQENPHAHHWQQEVEFPFRLMSEGEWAELLTTFGFQQVATERIADDTPVPDDYQPDAHWRSREEKLAFQRAGILVVAGKKPDLPPPGPIEPAQQKKPLFEILR
jgi:ubiquinone/menaquinone biosynthesis C-methylase UbiE